MHGQSYPILVYGFNLNTRDIRFDDEWMSSKYPDIECYALDIVRNYLGEPVYGISCDLDTVTGAVTAPDEKFMASIKELYNKYLEYYEKHIGKVENITLGYHVVVFGWDDECHNLINLDEDDEMGQEN